MHTHEGRTHQYWWRGRYYLDRRHVANTASCARYFAEQSTTDERRRANWQMYQDAVALLNAIDCGDIAA